ncbi:MAG: VWA domain-containing protein [Blastocatellia bacterium]|nr:VWA domain-containing protein [Blastocatellia bacterium]
MKFKKQLITLYLFFLILLILPIKFGVIKAQQVKKEDDSLISSRTELVTMTVSVTDSEGRFVAGLDKQHFKVYENNILQKIEFFSSEEIPISVGIIFDISGSMRSLLDDSRSILAHFIKTCRSDDEFFLVSFNNKVELLCDFTSDADKLAYATAPIQGKGSTALYDAVHFGLQKIRKSRHERRALIVISDNIENSSRYSLKDLKRLVQEIDVKVYGMHTLSDLTGGFYPLKGINLEAALMKIAIDLRRQYSIAYIPDEGSLKNSWNKLKVKVEPPKGLPKLSVRTKKGYSPRTLAEKEIKDSSSVK